MNLLIAIVNYRTPNVTLDCLASLAPQIDDVPDTHVIIVDNGSGDDSVSRLSQGIACNNWGRWASVIASQQNLGLAAGTNLALDCLLDHQETKYVLLLNSDTVVQPHVLKHCWDTLEATSSIGLISCKLLNPDQSVQNTARRLPTPLRMIAQSFNLPRLLPKAFAWADLDDPTWDRRTQAREVEWVGGAFMFIRRKMIDKVGGLDTRFFFYGEDVEFCRRIRKHNGKIWYDPSVAVFHLGGASSDPSRLDPKERNSMRWQARYMMQRRCYGIVAEFFLRLADIISFGMRFLKLLLFGGKNSPEFLAQKDVLALLLHWPTAAGKR